MLLSVCLHCSWLATSALVVWIGRRTMPTLPSTSHATLTSPLPLDDMLTSSYIDNWLVFLVSVCVCVCLRVCHNIVCVHVCVCVLSGEGPPFTMTESQVEAQAEHCNKKKKSAKTVEVYVH